MSSKTSPLRFKSILTGLGVVLLLSFFVADLSAQDAPAAPAAPAADPAGAAEGEPQTKTLMDQIIGGGVFMIPIGILSVWAITLSVFLSLQLSKNRFAPQALKDDILACMQDVRVRSAIDAAAQSPSYLGRMIASAYPLVDATDMETLGRKSVEDAVADFSVRENSRYMAWVGYLSVIAQGAPMLGLFGTVAGMVMAFDTMGLSGGSDPGALAGNISLALITTAGGLVVAIPAIFIFYFFKNRFNQLVNECQTFAVNGLEAALGVINADQALARVPEGLSDN